MSDLDEKLYAIWFNYVGNTRSEDNIKAIAEIKQEFIDAGWFRPSDAELVQQIVNARAQHKIEGQGTTAPIQIAPRYTPEQLKAISDELNKPRMTGQEWYDRFMAELKKPWTDEEIVEPFYQPDDQMYVYNADHVHEVAKKAAGIE